MTLVTTIKLEDSNWVMAADMGLVADNFMISNRQRKIFSIPNESGNERILLGVAGGVQCINKIEGMVGRF